MIELMMVTVIIGLLVLLAIPGYKGVQDAARTARAEAEIRDLEKAINAYAIDRGEFPTSLAAIDRLGAKDPWGRDYVYDRTPRLQDSLGSLLNHDFDLYSTGINGTTVDNPDDDDPTYSRCKDDIVRGGDGGYVGERKRYLLL